VKLLRYNEAAQMLRVSPLTLRKKVSEGTIPHLKPFGPHSRVYFDAEELERFLDASRSGGTSGEPK